MRHEPVSEMMNKDLKESHPLFRFHLLGLAHLPTHRDYSPCAYTQKVIKLARMLKNLGHTVFFYGGEGSEVACDEFVQVVSEAEMTGSPSLIRGLVSRPA